MKLTALVIVIFLAFAPFVTLAQSTASSVKVSFLSLTTAQEREAAPHGAFAPNVLLQFERQNGASRFLAMTGRDGTAFIPIEAGTYCVSAYGLDGKPARLSNYSSEKLHRCFTVKPGDVIEFSVTLAADAKWGGTIPTLGVK
jgi:hypothetical protein